MASIQELQLSGNIWEQQDGESPKHDYFKNLFIRSGEETIIDFANRMILEYESNSTDGFLQYKPYTKSYFSLLATKHHWLIRRDAFQSYNNAKLFADMDTIENNRKLERYELKEDIEYEMLEWLASKIKGRDPKLTGGQFKDYTQGGRNLQDSRNIDREKPTDYNKQQIDADVEADVNTSSNIKLDQKQIAERDLQLMQEFMDSKQ